MQFKRTEGGGGGGGGDCVDCWLLFSGFAPIFASMNLLRVSVVSTPVCLWLIWKI